ncbi:WhiB family transcriptional regulator [Rhodococcus aetherivorans]
MTEPTDPTADRGRGNRPRRYTVALPIAALNGSFGWTAYAKCAGLQPFFDAELPNETREESLTRHVLVSRICEGCPVRDDCLNFARANPGRVEGIYAGLFFGPYGTDEGRDPKKRRKYVMADIRRGPRNRTQKGNSK